MAIFKNKKSPIAAGVFHSRGQGHAIGGSGVYSVPRAKGVREDLYVHAHSSSSFGTQSMV